MAAIARVRRFDSETGADEPACFKVTRIIGASVASDGHRNVRGSM
jgi:hypothetical protein